MTEVQNDPDRVAAPAAPHAPTASFERVSWEEALDDIGDAAARASATTHGRQAIGWYMGNPGAFSYSHTLWVKGFLDALGSPHYYTAGSQDVNNRFAASRAAVRVAARGPDPRPRRGRGFLLMRRRQPAGLARLVLTRAAHPRAAHGDHRARRPRRRGRPAPHRDRARLRARRRSRPDADAWLLLSLLARDLRGGARGRGRAIAARRPAPSALRALAARLPARGDRGAHRRARPSTVRDAGARLRRAPTAPPSTAAPGRASAASARSSPSCSTPSTSSPATSTAPGGAVFGAAADRARRHRRARRPRHLRHDALARRRLPRRARQPAGFADAAGDRDARARARCARCSCRPATRCCRCPTATRWSARWASSTCCVSLDLYVNETNRHADYVLPATTFLEREDMPLAFLGFYATPFVQWTDAGGRAARRGARGVGGRSTRSRRRDSASLPQPDARLRALGRARRSAITPDAPRRPAAAHRARRRPVRPAPRRAVARPSCAARPHGVVLAEHVATGVLPSKSATAAAACASTRRRSSTSSRALAAAQRRTTPTSRCG